MYLDTSEIDNVVEGELTGGFNNRCADLGSGEESRR